MICENLFHCIPHCLPFHYTRYTRDNCIGFPTASVRRSIIQSFYAKVQSRWQPEYQLNSIAGSYCTCLDRNRTNYVIFLNRMVALMRLLWDIVLLVGRQKRLDIPSTAGRSKGEEKIIFHIMCQCSAFSRNRLGSWLPSSRIPD